MKILFLPLFALSLFVTSYGALAETSSIDSLKKALTQYMPKVKPDKISVSPIDGLFEVVVGTQVIYLSADARYMFEGNLYDLKTKKNVSEKAKSDIRLKAVDTLGVDKMLVYKPKDVKNVISVITDIDCPYCRRLHSEIPKYLENNVEVRYIFMPLKGAEDMKKTISVWCSDDQQLALDIAKAGGEVDDKTCKHPIKEHLRLSRALGVNGTPALLLENGQLIPGYVPFEKVLKVIEKL